MRVGGMHALASHWTWARDCLGRVGPNRTNKLKTSVSPSLFARLDRWNGRDAYGRLIQVPWSLDPETRSHPTDRSSHKRHTKPLFPREAVACVHLGGQVPSLHFACLLIRQGRHCEAFSSCSYSNSRSRRPFCPCKGKIESVSKAWAHPGHLPDAANGEL